MLVFVVLARTRPTRTPRAPHTNLGVLASDRATDRTVHTIRPRDRPHRATDCAAHTIRPRTHRPPAAAEITAAELEERVRAHQDQHGRTRHRVQPDGVHAALNDDEDADAFDGDDDCRDNPGAMGEYRKAVFSRLKAELAANFDDENNDQWLLGMLRAPGADWFIRAWRAPEVCGNLGIAYGEPAYYVDIYVCLPDVRWGAIDGMPPCVNGCRVGDPDAKIGVHGFQSGTSLNVCGRRVNGRRRHYFAMSE